MKTQKIKLIPLVNPNFNMLNTADELIELLKEQNFVICGKYPSDNVIGFVKPQSNFDVVDGWIYGAIVVNDDRKYEWCNAEGQIAEDKLINISGKFCKITAIYVKEIE